jgi:predicted ATPase
LHERLVGLSARALALAGQPANALDRLQELRTRLVEQLGIDPTAETVALEADLRGARPPAARMPLPMASRSFVGREQEQSVLLAETRAPGLITLLGGPGAGKTRLAREIAGRTTESGRPVAWLDLAPLRPGDDLVGALAAAVGATTADRSIGHSAELLTGALLVLDNAEHLVEEITAVVEALRFKAIDLSIVITSQRALRLSDERIERIGPLTAAAAEQLFCDRSGTGPSAAVARICAAVDRLPLGIELAAGLTRTLSVDQLADRIDQRLRLLVRGLRDAGTRHISLRSALDWSHELLEPRVRIALRRLSVFAGGCTPQAASAVLAGDGIDADQVAGLLTELVDRSLVTLDDGRFGLLETVREYALDQLRSSGEENAVRRKHADWCAQLATTGRPDGPLHRGPLFGRPELAHLMRLEEPNLLAAIDWCLQDGNDPGRVGDIVSPLSWHWAFRGLMQQAHTWLQASLDALPTGTPRRAQVLHGLAVLSRSIGRYDDAFAAGLECLEIRESLGDDRGIASICQMLTLISVAQGKAYAALNFGHRAELLARELGMPVALGASLNCSGLALRELGYPVEAKRMFEEAYELWTSAGNDEGVVIASGNLGIMAILAGDFAEARRLTLFGLRKARGIGYLLGLLETLVQLARIEVAEGNYARAVRVLAVIDRERAEKQTPIVVPDELAAFAAAWEDCRAALGVEADRLAELARHQSADALVAEILSS